MARRSLVDMEGNTGANTREKSCEKSPAGHPQGGGLDEETPTTRIPTLSFGRTPEEELAERNRGKLRRSDSRDRGDRNRGGGGKKKKMVGVTITTITVGVTAVVEAGEAHRVLVWLRAPPRWQQPGQWPQLWRRNGARGTFSVGRLVNLLPLVYLNSVQTHHFFFLRFPQFGRLRVLPKH